MKRPDSIEYAKNLVFSNLIITYLGYILLIPHILGTESFYLSLIGTALNLLIFYYFYNRKKWASMTYTIILLIGIFVQLINIKNYSSYNNYNSSIMSAICFVSVLMLSAIIYFLNTKESRIWFSEKKIYNNNNKIEIRNDTSSYKKNTNAETMSILSNGKEQESNIYVPDYKILINCPRCNNKMKVPGDRIVIAKCPNCFLEFKTNI